MGKDLSARWKAVGRRSSERLVYRNIRRLHTVGRITTSTTIKSWLCLPRNQQMRHFSSPPSTRLPHQNLLSCLSLTLGKHPLARNPCHVLGPRSTKRRRLRDINHSSNVTRTRVFSLLQTPNSWENTSGFIMDTSAALKMVANSPLLQQTG